MEERPRTRQAPLRCGGNEFWPASAAENGAICGSTQSNGGNVVSADDSHSQIDNDAPNQKECTAATGHPLLLVILCNCMRLRASRIPH